MVGEVREAVGQHGARTDIELAEESRLVAGTIEAKLDTTDTGDSMFHYVDKAKMAESAVLGTFVVALCGERFPVEASVARHNRLRRVG